MVGTGWQDVRMPAGYKLLAVAEQRGVVCVWAEVDPQAERVAASVCVVGTGWTLPHGVKHVGTALIGPFVWHVYTAAQEHASDE